MCMSSDDRAVAQAHYRAAFLIAAVHHETTAVKTALAAAAWDPSVQTIDFAMKAVSGHPSEQSLIFALSEVGRVAAWHVFGGPNAQ